jgi:hypothetical protein
VRRRSFTRRGMAPDHGKAGGQRERSPDGDKGLAGCNTRRLQRKEMLPERERPIDGVNIGLVNNVNCVELLPRVRLS